MEDQARPNEASHTVKVERLEQTGIKAFSTSMKRLLEKRSSESVQLTQISSANAFSTDLFTDQSIKRLELSEEVKELGSNFVKKKKKERLNDYLDDVMEMAGCSRPSRNWSNKSIAPRAPSLEPVVNSSCSPHPTASQAYLQVNLRPSQKDRSRLTVAEQR